MVIEKVTFCRRVTPPEEAFHIQCLTLVCCKIIFVDFEISNIIRKFAMVLIITFLPALVEKLLLKHAASTEGQRMQELKIYVYE